MSLRTRRAVRLLVAVAFTWVGVALFAHAALAWEAKIQVAKVNAGGAANDAFVFQPTITSTSGSAITAPFSLKGGELTAPFDVRCNAGNDCFSDLTQRVTEQPTPGYTLKDVSCRNTQGTNGNFADPPGPSSPLKPASEVSTDLATGTVDLKAHFLEWVLCTFTERPGRCAAAAGAHRGAIRAGAGAGAADPGLARACAAGQREAAWADGVPDLRRGRRARDRQAHRPRDVLRREPEGQDAPQAQSRQRVDALGEAAAPPGARAVPSTRARGVRGVEPHEAQDPADGRAAAAARRCDPVHRLTARKAWPRLPRRGAATRP